MAINKLVEEMVKQDMTDTPLTFFVMRVVRRNGEVREDKYPCVNQAVRALWKNRDVSEGTVTMYHRGKSRKLVAKIGRRRGINVNIFNTKEDRQILKKMGNGWHRLPSRFNEIK